MTMMTKAAPRPLAAPAGRKVLTAVPATLVKVVKHWQARRRSRIALSHLSDFHLRDIGLDPLIRDQEIGRPFWR
ncbi:MAG: DUF1127 domain-containing protein [Albidovulum sp.]|uniref:DUF1127 domain-containing protein n=1 Tax=Albidovulum sp. TaxID=1872424 RepID=UPI003C8BAA3B